MKIDPQLVTGMSPPTKPTRSKHRWIDIGGGCALDENTKRVMKISELRSPPVERMITLTVAEWAKLEALAQHRSTLKHTYTPQECVREFVNSCVVESTWEHPSIKTP